MKVVLEGINGEMFRIELSELDLRMLRSGERLYSEDRETRKGVMVLMYGISDQ